MFGAGILLLTAVESLVADDPLRDVKQLYQAAAYEEALAALVQVDGRTDIDQIDEYERSA